MAESFIMSAIPVDARIHPSFCANTGKAYRSRLRYRNIMRSSAEALALLISSRSYALIDPALDNLAAGDLADLTTIRSRAARLRLEDSYD